jgi:hypothetical protein
LDHFYLDVSTRNQNRLQTYTTFVLFYLIFTKHLYICIHLNFNFDALNVEEYLVEEKMLRYKSFSQRGFAITAPHFTRSHFPSPSNQNKLWTNPVDVKSDTHNQNKNLHRFCVYIGAFKLSLFKFQTTFRDF